MKYKVVGISKPQYSRLGLLMPDSEIEVFGKEPEKIAGKIKYLEKIDDSEEEVCQKNAKLSLLIKKRQNGVQKSLSMPQKKNF